MKKYFEIFKYGIKKNLAFIVDYIFSLFSYGIFIFVFNELWDYILQGKLVAGYTKIELIWYIIIAEFVILSSNRMFQRISEMVKNGDIANMLTKPVEFVFYILADNLSIVIKAIINLIFGIILGILLAGPIEVTVVSIILTLFTAMLAVFMGILLQIFVGLLAFYTEENRSFWLIIQKAAFLLVFTPIEFYPEIVQKILLILPTTYMVYVPGKIFVDFHLRNSFGWIGMEILAAIVLYVGIQILYRRGVRKINVNGG